MNRRNKKRGVFLGVAALFSALAACLVFKSSKLEPLYHGQPVSFWIAQLGSPNRFKIPDAFEAFFRPETNALPFLIRTLETRQPLLQRVIDRVRPKLPSAWQRKLPFPNENIGKASRIAIGAIALIGPGARDAIPALVQCVDGKDEAVRYNALIALSQMNPEDLRRFPQFSSLTYNKHASAFWPALSVINDFGPGARSAVPFLCEILKSGSDSDKGSAAVALAKIRVDAVAAVPDLVETVRTNRVWGTRMFALNALKQIVPQSAAFSNAVVFVLSDENDQVRLHAVEDGLEMQMQLQIILPALLRTMRSDDASYRWQAMRILESSGPLKSFAVFDLIAQLSDDNNRVRGLAAIVLGKLGPAAKPAVPALTAALKDEYVNVRDAAAEALKMIAPDESK